MRLPFVQYVASLAVVQAVQEQARARLAVRGPAVQRQGSLMTAPAVRKSAHVWSAWPRLQERAGYAAGCECSSMTARPALAMGWHSG